MKTNGGGVEGEDSAWESPTMGSSVLRQLKGYPPLGWLQETVV